MTRRSRDSGQAFAIYITVVASLLVLAFLYFAVGQASASRNEAQSAADAAALAAAQDARDQLGLEGLGEKLLDPDFWEDFFNGDGVKVGFACAEAGRFAAQNGANVVDLDGDGDAGCDRLGLPEDGFTIEVRAKEPVGKSLLPGTENEYAEATATAVIEPRCKFEKTGEGKKARGKLVCDDDKDWELGDKPGIDLPGPEDLFAVHLDD
ncbi:hypothetical protein G5C51_24530 [Streptomyces sp. A7024]|uniref:Putative Flp pilus-assembly TadG-like N-terminal domain-containing protein n=1 Tax=Streptomyces coryli TaxID=1128680 RepID=A0A6G4U790_9ACTN|nr:hypothetical protein [Streptomyces coryli]